MTKVDDLRTWFEIHVRDNYDEWSKEWLNKRLAHNCIAAMNNFAERAFKCWGPGSENTMGANTAAEYRNKLAKKVTEFGLVRDIAEAHKHVCLNRGSRKVTSEAQTNRSPTGFGEAGYGEGSWGGSDALIVTCDDGTKRHLRGIAEKVMKMWQCELKRWEL